MMCRCYSPRSGECRVKCDRVQIDCITWRLAEKMWTSDHDGCLASAAELQDGLIPVRAKLECGEDRTAASC
jgi:hypothetical protein